MWPYHNPNRVRFGIDRFDTGRSLAEFENYLLVTCHEGNF